MLGSFLAKRLDRGFKELPAQCDDLRTSPFGQKTRQKSVLLGETARTSCHDRLATNDLYTQHRKYGMG
ncbi:MAG: hypothetical protein C4334_02320 [Pyrinomonas sp.]